jgi:hypothetical protein
MYNKAAGSRSLLVTAAELLAHINIRSALPTAAMAIPSHFRRLHNPGDRFRFFFCDNESDMFFFQDELQL